MEQTTTTLTTAIAELTKQVEQLTLENAKLREGSVPGDAKSSEVISQIIKSIPREVILEVLGEDVCNYVHSNYRVEQVYSRDAIVEYVSNNCKVEEVFSKSAEVNLENVDSAVICEYVRWNYGVEEVYSKRQIVEYVKRDIDMDDVYDSDDIVEWVKDNRNACDIYDVDCVTEWSLDDVLMEFGESVVMEEIENQGWSKSKDVSDIISTLEDVIEQLKA